MYNVFDIHSLPYNFAEYFENCVENMSYYKTAEAKFECFVPTKVL